MRVLIGTADEELAKAIAEVLDERWYAPTMDALLTEADHWQPDVVLVDVRLGRSGLRAVEFVPTLCRLAPDAAVLILSVAPTQAERREAGVFGAAAVIDRYRLRELPMTIKVARVAVASRDSGGALAPELRRRVH